MHPHLREVSRSKAHGGHVVKYAHDSAVLGCEMKVSVFLPPQHHLSSSASSPSSSSAAHKLPVLFWLSGLTCNEDNFMQKAGGQRKLAELGMVLICPDTSPRGLGIEGEDDSWDLGTGAGFYVDATTEKWKNGYRMYSYITKELRELINASFDVDEKRTGIFGHSMGGHGALVIGLKNPDIYHSMSAFAPIANPTDCQWGHKAFGAYLGDANKEAWKAYDASLLLKAYKGPARKILVDQGTADQFLKDGQLHTERLSQVKNDHVEVSVRQQHGYDHSYYFISSFVDEHLSFHAEQLK
ncbi:hypothetical protein HDU86_000511 [Geranomyces michiganensis]|nr:hypothetical protein HDU86_000511 [Geranomyces michiganensis]